MIYDTIVIGGGPSALSAALYLGRYKLKTLIITDSFGGLAGVAGAVDNYTGIETIDGFELVQNMVKQVKKLEDVEIKEGEAVSLVSGYTDGFKVATSNSEFMCKTVLVCIGKQPRKLGVTGEDELIGKGLSYCATCDGPLAKGRDVIVIGGGRSATEAAITLSKTVNKITIVNINDSLAGEKVTLDKLEALESVKQINNAETKNFILKDNLIKGVNYTDKTSSETNQALGDMVFVEIGQVANSKPFKDLVDTNKASEIVVDLKTNKTSQEGIFASGDITDIEFKQIVIAAGEGAKAVLAVTN